MAEKFTLYEIGIIFDKKHYHGLPSGNIQPSVELQELCDSLLPLFGIPRLMVSTLEGGYFNEHPDHVAYAIGYRIYFQKWIVEEFRGSSDLTEVLKHEMTHCWVNHHGIKEVSHGPRFQAKLREVL